MKRTLLAALLCCAAGAVLADGTNVTLYGVVDMGYSWRGDNYNGNIGSRHSLDSGEFSGPRIGFKGEERLSAGLKALFTIETGIALDTGVNNQGGLAWGRQTFVGLEQAGLGTLTLGRQYTPVRNLYVVADPFVMGTVGRVDNTFRHVQGRADNTVVINTPYYGDIFAIEAMYSNNFGGNEAIENADDKRYVNLAPRVHFFDDRLRLALSYQQWKRKDAPAKNDSWDLVGMGFLPFMTVSAAYSRFDSGANADGTVKLLNGRKPKFDRYFLGGKMPAGNFSFVGSYTYSKDRNDADIKAQQLALGTFYALSKRTSLYGAVSRMFANNATGAYQDSEASTRGFDLQDGNNPGYGYRSGVSLGMTHVF
jgi:predicted porin